MISVIIPVYNLEKYLPASLNSILQQTYPDLQILCVDDMSQDSSLHILREYAAKDKRIQVYTSTVKGYPGGARNIGLTHATGDYIYFCDGDDLLEPEAMATLVQAAQTHKLDIVYFNSAVLNELKAQGLFATDDLFSLDHITDSICSGPSYFCTLVQHKRMCYCVWQQFYKASFLKSLQLKYMEGLPHEDDAWTFITMLSAKRVQHLPQTLYTHRLRQDSIMTGIQLTLSLKGITVGLRLMQDFLHHLAAQPEIRSQTLFCALRHLEKFNRLMGDRFLKAPAAEQLSCLQNPDLQIMQITHYLTKVQKIQAVLGARGIQAFYNWRRFCLLWQWLKLALSRS
jgi:glycosyltransferase involved in cell wall biosynthesis